MNVKTPTLKSSDPQIRDRVLELSLRTFGSQTVTGVSFAHDNSDYGLRIRIDGENYSCQISEKTCVAVPELSPEISVAVITGRYVCGPSLGSILVVVNCGYEPPTLQVSRLPLAGSARYWSWEITHDIQHQILEFFDGTDRLPINTP
jgi:hypothetical protein